MKARQRTLAARACWLVPSCLAYFAALALRSCFAWHRCMSSRGETPHAHQIQFHALLLEMKLLSHSQCRHASDMSQMSGLMLLQGDRCTGRPHNCQAFRLQRLASATPESATCLSSAFRHACLSPPEPSLAGSQPGQPWPQLWLLATPGRRLHRLPSSHHQNSASQRPAVEPQVHRCSPQPSLPPIMAAGLLLEHSAAAALASDCPRSHGRRTLHRLLALQECAMAASVLAGSWPCTSKPAQATHHSTVVTAAAPAGPCPR